MVFRLSFAGGVRTCIGWKFALYEMLALTVEIINNFELNITPDIDRLRREACLVMLPTLEGEQLRGENLPLRVNLAARDWFDLLFHDVVNFCDLFCSFTFTSPSHTINNIPTFEILPVFDFLKYFQKTTCLFGLFFVTVCKNFEGPKIDFPSLKRLNAES